MSGQTYVPTSNAWPVYGTVWMAGRLVDVVLGVAVAPIYVLPVVYELENVVLLVYAAPEAVEVMTSDDELAAPEVVS